MPKIELELTTKGFDKASGNIKGVFSDIVSGVTLANLATDAARKALDFIKDLPGKLINSASSLENLNAEFGVMLGSATAAKKLTSEIKALGAATPFTTQQLSNSIKTLLQFNVSQDEVIDTMRMLGDVAGNSGERLSSLSLIFGQISSLGKLQGQDLLQLINVGFNPLQIIADKTGKSMATLRDEMSKGLISADAVKEAFKIATSEGGLFFQNMQTQSQTFTGLVSTLNDNMGTFGALIGAKLLPFAKQATSALSSLFATLNTEIASAEQIENIEKERDSLNLLVGEITSSNIENETRSALLANLKRDYPAFNELIKGEKTNNNDLVEKLKEVNNAYINRIVLAKQQQEIDKQANTVAALKKKQWDIEYAENKKIAEQARKYHIEDKIDLGDKIKTIKLLEEEYKKRQPLELQNAKILTNELTAIGSIKVKEEQRLALQLQIDKQNNISNGLNDKKKELIASLNIDIKEMNELTQTGTGRTKENNKVIQESVENQKASNKVYQESITQIIANGGTLTQINNGYYTSLEKVADARNKLAEEENKRLQEETKEKEAARKKQYEEDKAGSIQTKELAGNTYSAIYNAFQSAAVNIANTSKNLWADLKNGIQVSGKDIANFAGGIASGVLDMVGSIISSINTLQQDQYKAQEQALQDALDAQIESIQAYYAAQAEEMGIAEETETEKNNASIAELEEQLSTEKDVKQKAKIQEQIKELKDANARIELEKKMNADITAAKKKEAEEEKKLKKDAWDANRDSQVTSLWISALSGVATIWGTAMQLGPIAGPIMAGILTAAILATAGAETGLIYQQKNPYAEMGGVLSGTSTTGDKIPVNMNSKEVIYRDDVYQGTVEMFKDYKAGKFGGGITIQSLSVHVDQALTRNELKVMIDDLMISEGVY
jgi:tape measure domain-containing protein